MKTLNKLVFPYALGILAFCAFLVFAGRLYTILVKKSPAYETFRSNENGIVPEKVIEDLKNAIAQREYHISYNKQTQTLQSPNRAQNLRAHYKPGKFTIQNRTDSTGHHFKLDLINKGIFADGRKLRGVTPTSRTVPSGNTLLIRHDGFSEEFINNEQGVRQNFIIDSAPAGTAELTVHLQVQGLQAREGSENEIRFFSNEDGAIVDHLVYNDLRCWDSNQKPLEASLKLIGNQIAIRVNVADAAYPVTIDPLVTNGNPNNANKTIEIDQSNAWVGFAVSSAGDVNGDGYSDVIVGAPKYDMGQADEGAAFVFNGSAAGLSLAATTLEGNQAGAQAGYSVATAGDFNGDGYSDVLVGAPYYDDIHPNEGVALLYLGSAAGITSQPYKNLTGGPQVDANWGISVATAGDINGDGLSDILFGGYQYDNGQSNEGGVLLMYGSPSGIGNNVVLECNQADAMFGYAIAPAGDINADGYSDVIVGARLYDKGELNEGAVFVYKGSSFGLEINNPTILESNQTDARMGHSLATAGDVNGDTYSDIAVGIYMLDNGQSNEGAVRIYHGSAAGISNGAAITLEGNQAGAQYGWSVNCAGDVNGDGYSDLVIGARFFDNGQNNEGAAFVYRGSANGLIPTAAAIIESNLDEAWLGSAVASAGDVNGDGYSDLIIGSYTYDKGQNDEGVAFVYHGGAEGVGTNAFAQITGNNPGGEVGCAVASAGDVNGDGYSDVIIGARYYDLGEIDEGVAFLYYGSASGLITNNYVTLQENKAESRFGTSVSGAGDLNGDGFDDVVVGADTYANGQAYEGAVFIYHGSAAGLTPQAAIHFERNFANSYMGCSVAGAGDVNRDGYADIIVGADGVNAAYVYQGSANGVTGNPTILQIINQPDNQFGTSVASAGDVNGDGYADVIVGADWYDDAENNEGAAFIFHGSAAGTSTNAATILQSNQAGALMGRAVGGAGDLNGDGYSDIIVSAPDYDKGENNEGIVFIYYGASGGITNLSPSKTLEINKADAYFGSSVRSAGDVNGDGYSDIVVGTEYFTEGQQFEGAAYIFHGSRSGIESTFAFSLQANINDAGLGCDVATGGDINGDGYSDVLVGANGYPNGLDKTGSAFVYYGNNTKGLRNSVRLLNSDLVSPINHSQFNQPNFVGALYAKSFIGRNKGKFVWEAMGPGVPFSKIGSNPITTSNLFTGASGNFASLSGLTTLMGGLITKSGIATKVRVRTRYSPVLAITGQIYSPWRYLQSQLAGYNNTPVPEETTVETSQRNTIDIYANNSPLSATPYPNPVSDKLFIKAEQADQVRSIRIFTPGGKLIYQSQNPAAEIDVRNFDSGIYLLRITRQDGSESSHNVIVKK